jgi:hypothetical protein
MFKSWSKKKIIIFLLSFTILSGVIFLPVIYSLSDKLSETKRVNANILVVEGWIQPYAIRMAFNEFKKNGYDHIVTTGLNSTPDYFNVFTDGSLIFYTHKKLQIDTAYGKHNIEIRASSSLGGVNRAHFNVLINDSISGDFLADKMKKNFTILWKGRLSDIDSVSVRFLNDMVGDFGDRNLYIKEVIFDHKISVPYQLNSIYTYSESDRIIKIRNDYTSYAQHARNSLIAMGLDTSLVVSIPGDKVAINRTLTSALVFRDWLKTSGIDVKGINIVTLGTHARRTWMIYNKILDKKYDIGIISLPDYKANHSRKYKVLKTIRETIGIIYYWFILLPY